MIPRFRTHRTPTPIESCGQRAPSLLLFVRSGRLASVGEDDRFQRNSNTVVELGRPGGEAREASHFPALSNTVGAVAEGPRSER